jgi:DNA repair ATPase RecN
MAPRLHSLQVRNFQSLHNVSLNLEAFTVIVGPSSSGKSALTRALRTLVSNRRGTEWITTGERVASITATTDHGTVTLTRSRTQQSSENAYTLTPLDDTTEQRTYAKLGGDTPEDVSRFLGIDSGTTAAPPINFAGQFDKPFLLDDSAADVARTLGALTGVNVIFEAARESNRRKLNASGTLRTRTQDLENIKSRIPEFRALKAQDASLQAAEAKIAQARTLAARITALTQAIEVVEVTQPLIDRLTPQAALIVPDVTTILEAQQRLQALIEAITRVGRFSKDVTEAQAVYEEVDAQEAAALQRYAFLSGTITQDLTGYFLVHANLVEIEDERYVTVDEAVAVFLKFLETKAAS